MLLAAGCTPAALSASGEQLVLPSATQSATQTATPEPSATPSPSATPQPPTMTPTPLTCWEDGGRMELGSLDSVLLPEPLDYRVYLPPCYDAQPDRRYPVLYYIHGSTYNDDQWDRIGADETADRLVADGIVEPFIIVMPRDRVWSEPPDDAFGEAIVADLIPFIDETYRTIADRNGRAVGGLSRGAAWAVHLGISHWELFSSIGAHSMVIFAVDMAPMRGWLRDIPTDQQPRILIDDGKGDRYYQQAQWFRGRLVEEGYEPDWRLYEGYHNEDYWREHVEEYLMWYAEGWQREP